MGGRSGNNDEAGQRPAQADRGEAVLTAPQNNKHMEDKCSLEFLNFKVWDRGLVLRIFLKKYFSEKYFSHNI